MNTQSDVHSSAEWIAEKNARRFELIDKEVAGTLTESEKAELGQLTQGVRECVDMEALVPMEGPSKLLQELLAKKE